MKNKAPISIKRNLIFSAAVLSSLLVLGSWFFMYTETRHEIDEVFDAHLGQSAKTLALAAMSWGDSPPKKLDEIYADWFSSINKMAVDEETATPYGHPYEKKVLFQYLSNGKLVGKSANAPDVFLGTLNEAGYKDVTFEGERWRTFQLPFTPPGDTSPAFTILVAEKIGIREELTAEVALSIGLPQILLIPFLIALIALLVNRYFRPIEELRKLIASKSINNLQRIRVENATIELEPLVNQINFLLAELENAWKRERRLISTAAHELKTPLAVLRLNAENAIQSDDEKERNKDLSSILAGIDRTDRVIQQLLVLSRVEQQKDIVLQPMDLVSMLREEIANLVPISLKYSQTISLVGAEKASVNAHPVMLSILFANLIDNAIRYSGQGSSITVDVELLTDSSQVAVTVSDKGMAMPDDVRQRIFDKFYRGHSNKGDGAGLGMSIVKDIAQIHSANVQVKSAGEGESGNQFVVVFDRI
ncbi:ATP-binding protein [Enterovibrio sp. 27052020O]|uniref:ATP-binding protein n=1 Tax=Enterovibrio sp. 27052020O TaxID=3241166 RepID=UPI00388DDF7F